MNFGEPDVAVRSLNCKSQSVPIEIAFRRTIPGTLNFESSNRYVLRFPAADWIRGSLIRPSESSEGSFDSNVDQFAAKESGVTEWIAYTSESRVRGILIRIPISRSARSTRVCYTASRDTYRKDALRHRGAVLLSARERSQIFTVPEMGGSRGFVLNYEFSRMCVLFRANVSSKIVRQVAAGLEERENR